MGHSFTTFRNKHIRSKDYKIETWLFLVVREIDEFENCPSWLEESRHNWLEEAQLSLNGCMDLQFDKFLNSQEKVNLFREICKEIIGKLESFGEKIPKDFLNELCGYKPPCDIKDDNQTQLYLSYGKALLKLLDGEQTEKLVNV